MPGTPTTASTRPPRNGPTRRHFIPCSESFERVWPAATKANISADTNDKRASERTFHDGFSDINTLQKSRGFYLVRSWYRTILLRFRALADSLAGRYFLLRRREFALPAGNHGGREAIAGDVYGRAAHVHERVDSENHEDRLDRQAKGSGGAHQDHQSRARHAGDALAHEHQREDHEELRRPGHVDARHLSHEERGDREVKRRAVEIETVACRNDECDDPARHAELLHAFHRARQSRFRRACCKRDRRGFGDSAQEPAK